MPEIDLSKDPYFGLSSTFARKVIDQNSPLAKEMTTNTQLRTGLMILENLDPEGLEISEQDKFSLLVSLIPTETTRFNSTFDNLKLNTHEGDVQFHKTYVLHYLSNWVNFLSTALAIAGVPKRDQIYREPSSVWFDAVVKTFLEDPKLNALSYPQLALEMPLFLSRPGETKEVLALRMRAHARKMAKYGLLPPELVNRKIARVARRDQRIQQELQDPKLGKKLDQLASPEAISPRSASRSIRRLKDQHHIVDQPVRGIRNPIIYQAYQAIPDLMMANFAAEDIRLMLTGQKRFPILKLLPLLDNAGIIISKTQIESLFTKHGKAIRAAIERLV